MPDASEITRLLQEAELGNQEAVNRLFVLVQNDLRAIAVQRKRGAGADVDMSITALVNDAFLRLVGQDQTVWQAGDRRKFFTYISVKMHDVLIQRLRSEKAVKRGGRQKRVEPQQELEDVSAQPIENLDMLVDLKEALGRFEKFAEVDAILFRIRFFLGCTFEEAADILDVSVSETKRAWLRARLWLQSELREYNLDT